MLKIKYHLKVCLSSPQGKSISISIIEPIKWRRTIAGSGTLMRGAHVAGREGKHARGVSRIPFYLFIRLQLSWRISFNVEVRTRTTHFATVVTLTLASS